MDKLINPHWPYLPQSKEDDENQDEIERALSSVPDDPMNYDFFYHILEADDSGRQPKIEVATEVDEHGTAIKTQTLPNPKFNHKSLSCLRRIAESGNKVCVVETLKCRAKSAHRTFCGLKKRLWSFLGGSASKGPQLQLLHYLLGY